MEKNAAVPIRGLCFAPYKKEIASKRARTPHTTPTEFHILILLVSGFIFLFFSPTLLTSGRSCSSRVTVAHQLQLLFSLLYWPKRQGCMQRASISFSFLSLLNAMQPDVQIFSLSSPKTFYPSLFWLTFSILRGLHVLVIHLSILIFIFEHTKFCSL